MRLVLTVGFLCVTTALLGGCHKRFHVSVKNETGQKIHVVIQFRDPPTGYGDIDVDNGIDLTQKIEDIHYIDYQIGKQNCHIDKDAISEIARLDPDSQFHKERMVISLQDCSKTPQPEAAFAK